MGNKFAEGGLVVSGGRTAAKAEANGASASSHSADWADEEVSREEAIMSPKSHDLRSGGELPGQTYIA